MGRTLARSRNMLFSTAVGYTRKTVTEQIDMTVAPRIDIIDMKKLFSVLLLLLFLLGCSDNVDIGLVAEQLHQAAAAQPESAVQTILPDDVLAAMQHKTDQLDRARELILGPLPNPLYNSPEVIDFFRKRRDAYLAAGVADLDFHALQKAFYTKYIDAGGIAIVANNKVEDVFLIAARDAVLLMTSKYPELRERLLSKHRRFYMVLIKDYLDFHDVPEFQLDNFVIKGTSFGFAGICSASSYDLKAAAKPAGGDCVATVSIGDYPLRTFIHEFAHVLEPEMAHLDTRFLARLEAVYAAKIAEVGEGKAAKSWNLANASEYWAYGVEWWFGARDRLFEPYPLEQHPQLAELMAEWFPRVAYNKDLVSWKIVEEE